jgi:hypothetical protein
MSENETPAAPASNTEPHTQQGAPPRARARQEPNPGFVVTWGPNRERMARFPTEPVAVQQGARQRVRNELVQFWDGEQWGQTLEKRARPLFEVKEGESFEEARKRGGPGS